MLLLVFVITFLSGWAVVHTQAWHGTYSNDSIIGVQKFHTEATPRIGGVAVLIGSLVAWAFASSDLQAILGPLLVAGMPAFAFGLAEDLTKRVSISMRLLATMASGMLGWAITGQSITDVNVPGLDWLLGFTMLSVVFTAFAVGGVANAINIIDGFNGLAAGTVIIILCAFALMSGALGDADLMQTCFILVGVVFARWGRVANRPEIGGRNDEGPEAFEAGLVGQTPVAPASILDAADAPTDPMGAPVPQINQ